MILSLDVRRAHQGDCLLLHYGTRDDRGLVVVDGGPSRTYRPQLLPRLQAIRAARALAPNQPLPIDLLMVSHIDDDHLNGILELTGDLVEARDAHRPPLLRIRAFWHNTFDDIVGNDPGHLLAAITGHFGAAALSGDSVVDGLDPHAAKVLASVGQGVRLRDDVRKLQLPLNPHFGGELVRTGQDSPAVADLGRGLRLTVAGPMTAELRRLQRDHDRFLQAQTDDPSAPLAAFTDTSVPNLSSLVVLCAAGGRRILLTGDARGDKILEGLGAAGLLDADGQVHVDILKMPHHGSDRNMTQRFLERVTAHHYVFSGNGEHGNPERATLEMLRLARGAAGYAVHLTYPIDEIDVARQAAWERRHDQPWSPARQGLSAFFDLFPDMAARVRVVPADQPHLIELIDPVGL